MPLHNVEIMVEQSKYQKAPPRPEMPAGKHYHVKPNALKYTDDQGIQRMIYIPRGKNEEVTKHFVDKDWEALSKFPAYTGAADQQYTEEDYYTPADGEE